MKHGPRTTAAYSPEIQTILAELVQVYIVRINGEDLALFGPLLPHKEDTPLEIDDIFIGEPVHVSTIITMLQQMQERNKSGMSQLQ